MQSVKVFGCFTKRNNNIFRTSTYIQFGNSERYLGACVMCNPGASFLLHITQEHQRSLDSGNEVFGEAKMDDTMKQIRSIIEEVYGEHVEGRVQIFNLFTTKDAKMESAVQEFSNLSVEKELLLKDYNDFTAQVHEFPWVIIGWGCEDNAKLNKEKRRWIELIREKNRIIIGIQGKKEIHFLHPLPHIYNKRADYIKNIVQLFREKGVLSEMDPYNPKSGRNPIAFGLNIILNGKQIDFIPEMRLDLTRDLLISNGHIVVARYIGDYSGCLGFFAEEGDCLPVAWIHDTQAEVHIEVYDNKEGKIVVIDHNYVIDITEF